MNTDQVHPVWCGGPPSCTAFSDDPDLDPTHRSLPTVLHMGDETWMLTYASALPARYWQGPGGDQWLPATEPFIEIEEHNQPVDLTGQWWRTEPYQSLFVPAHHAVAFVGALQVLAAAINPNTPPTEGHRS